MLLDIILSNTVFVLIIIVIAFAFIALILSLNERREKIDRQTNKYHELEIETTRKDGELQTFKSEMGRKVQEMALIQVEKWKIAELEGYKKIADDYAQDTAKILLQRWLIDNEDRIRKDAANRSVRVVMGKVTEHLIPFSEAFSQFNPKDARFIGSPIDLIVFDGVEDKKDEVTIFFLEIKTGNSALSPKQRKIMEAVKSKRIEWLRLTIKDFGEEVNKTL